MYQILIFGASWCTQCNLLKDSLKKKPLPIIPNVHIKHIDIDEEEDNANQNNVTELPTIIMFKNNIEISRSLNIRTSEQLENFIINNLSND